MSRVVEHRFTTEQSTHTDAIEPAHEATLVVPGFHRMGPASLMEVAIRLDDAVIDPGVGTIRVSASCDDVAKGAIDGRRLVLGRLAQTASDLEMTGKQNTSIHGRPPRCRPLELRGHLLVSDGHGKDTLMECRQHQVGAESPGAMRSSSGH